MWHLAHAIGACPVAQTIQQGAGAREVVGVSRSRRVIPRTARWNHARAASDRVPVDNAFAELLPIERIGKRLAEGPLVEWRTVNVEWKPHGAEGWGLRGAPGRALAEGPHHSVGGREDRVGRVGLQADDPLGQGNQNVGQRIDEWPATEVGGVCRE